MNRRTVDTNLMCCHLTKQDADCDFAYVDSFASCETLFRNRAPRECLWVVGIMSLVGAVFVIVWRLVSGCLPHNYRCGGYHLGRGVLFA